ncbi:hypothetical protein SRABI106_04276 [Rahnella aquatilis]|nr:hypothetical protein SRABI106_04276 [Rahnella aquatilis]
MAAPVIEITDVCVTHAELAGERNTREHLRDGYTNIGGCRVEISLGFAYVRTTACQL